VKTLLWVTFRDTLYCGFDIWLSRLVRSVPGLWTSTLTVAGQELTYVSSIDRCWRCSAETTCCDCDYQTFDCWSRCHGRPTMLLCLCASPRANQPSVICMFYRPLRISAILYRPV